MYRYIKKIIGIYYDIGEIIPNRLSIYDYRGNQYNPYISYCPNTKIQEDLGVAVIENALKWFKDFQKFDSIYANEEYDNLDTDVFETEKLNLFQLVFCSNVHGVI